jgi:hypothetical protein
MLAARLLDYSDGLLARHHNVLDCIEHGSDLPHLVESTWLKMLRYQCTTGSLKKWPAHPLYAAISRIIATVKAGAPVRCEEPRMGSSRRSSAEEDCGRQVPHYARGWSNGAMFGLSSLHRLPPRT